MFNNRLKRVAEIKEVVDNTLLEKLRSFESSYKDSKEYLDKQQKIDYLLVLTKLAELNPVHPGIEQEKEIRSLAGKEILKTLESLK